MTWIMMTLFAAFFQAWRNALQSQLSGSISVAGVTVARFLLAVPIAILYLAFLTQFQDHNLQLPDVSAVKFILGASISQILATGLMVILFKQNNYAVGAGLAKSEACVAALLGTLFFGSTLSWQGWVGVILGSVAVLMLSGFNFQQFRFKTACMGMACGTTFAITSLWVREATLSSQLPFPLGAAWVLLSVVSCQSLVLSLYISFVERGTWHKILKHRYKVSAVGVTSYLGSLGWFSAMSLQEVAYVKTLGQIEVFFMILISIWWLKKPVRTKDGFALILIGLAAILVIIN